MIDRKAMAPAAGRCSSGWARRSGPTTLVASLSIAEQQLVEIARALHAKSKILVLDEPTTPCPRARPSACSR